MFRHVFCLPAAEAASAMAMPRAAMTSRAKRVLVENIVVFSEDSWSRMIFFGIFAVFIPSMTSYRLENMTVQSI